MRANLLMAVALTALVACDIPNDTPLRSDLSEDYYGAVGLGENGRKFRREVPFFVDLEDEYSLSPEAAARLDAQAAWMADHPTMRFLVIAMGPAQGAMVPTTDPSHQRADTVIRHLVAQGASPDMIRARVVPAVMAGRDFDPLERVTTFVEEGMGTKSNQLLAVSEGPGLQGDMADAPLLETGGLGTPVASSGSVPEATGDEDEPGEAGTPPTPTGSGTTSINPAMDGPSPNESGPAPSGPGGKNAAKREANSGRGNGDEAGDPGNSGGRNRGGDEVS